MDKTMRLQDLEFQRLVDMPYSGCVFCEAQEIVTQKKKFFLVFSNQRRIYIQHALKNFWEEVRDFEIYERIRKGFNRAVVNRKIS